MLVKRAPGSKRYDISVSVKFHAVHFNEIVPLSTGFINTLLTLNNYIDSWCANKCATYLQCCPEGNNKGHSFDTRTQHLRTTHVFPYLSALKLSLNVDIYTWPPMNPSTTHYISFEVSTAVLFPVIFQWPVISLIKGSVFSAVVAFSTADDR